MELTTVPIDKPDDVNFIPLRKRERQRVAVCRDDRAGTRKELDEYVKSGQRDRDRGGETQVGG